MQEAQQNASENTIVQTQPQYVYAEENEIDLLGLVWHFVDRWKSIAAITLIALLLGFGYCAYSYSQDMAKYKAVREKLTADSAIEISDDSGSTQYIATAELYIPLKGNFKLDMYEDTSPYDIEVEEIMNIVNRYEFKKDILNRFGVEYDDWDVDNYIKAERIPSTRGIRFTVQYALPDVVVAVVNHYVDNAALIVSEHLLASQLGTDRSVNVYKATIASKADPKLATTTSAGIISKPTLIKTNTLLIAAFLGFFLMCAVYFCQYLGSKRLFAPEQIKRETGLTVVAFIADDTLEAKLAGAQNGGNA